jgi:hypothetical protein
MVRMIIAEDFIWAARIWCRPIKWYGNQRGTLTFNHMRNMYNTFLILLSAALLSVIKYWLCVHLVEFILLFCVCAITLSTVLWCSLPFPRQTNVRFVYIAISFLKSWIACFICYLYLSMYSGVQHLFHIRWCSCCLTVTQRVPLIKLELLTFTEQLSSPQFLAEYVLCNR